MKRGFLKTFDFFFFFLEKTFKIWVGVIHGPGQYTSKYGIAPREQTARGCLWLTDKDFLRVQMPIIQCEQ
jgi:hypothetical protein